MTKELTKNPLWASIEHIYITPLIRTKQTADIIFPKDIERTIIPEFAEVDFGDYEGRFITPENKNDIIFRRWLEYPEEETFPNGENLIEHNDKAINTLNKIICNSLYENIAIVSHATNIRLMLSQLMTGSIHYFRNIPCENAGVCKLEVDSDGKIKVKYINASISLQ